MSALQLSNLPTGRLVDALAMLALLTFALPTLYPPLWDAEFGDTSRRGALDFELSGVALGTTSTGDFLPVTVAQTPLPDQALVDTLWAGRADRFDYGSVSGARVHPLRLDDLDAEYELETTGGFTARFLVFAFSGWQAYVDERPVASRPSGGSGFIQFDVPVSARSFGIRFESTPPRTIGAVVSLIGGLAIIVLVAVSIGQTAPAQASASQSSVQPSHPAGRGAGSRLTSQLTNQTNPVFFTVLAFLAIKSLLIDPCDTCFRYTSSPGQALAATNKQEAIFGSQIALLGFDLPKPEVQPGESIPLTLYWRATAPVPVNYQVFAHLTRPAFVLWGQSDKLNPGDFPSTRWPLDKYVWDDHLIRVLPGTPPGDYNIVVGLYTLSDGRRAPVLDATGATVGDSVQLSLPVRVVRAPQPPPIDSLGLQTRPGVTDQGDVMLLGASIEQARLARPNFVRMTLFWQALVAHPANVTVRVRMLDRSGQVANEIDSVPTGGAYPPSEWWAAEIVRDVYAFWLPPDFAPGKYTLQVSIEYAAGRVGPSIDLGEVEVTE